MRQKKLSTEANKMLSKKILFRTLICSGLGLVFAMAVLHLSKEQGSTWSIVGLSMIYVFLITMISFPRERKD